MWINGKLACLLLPHTLLKPQWHVISYPVWGRLVFRMRGVSMSRYEYEKGNVDRLWKQKVWKEPKVFHSNHTAWETFSAFKKKKKIIWVLALITLYHKVLHLGIVNNFLFSSRLKQLARRCLQREFHMLLLVKFQSLVFRIRPTGNPEYRHCHFYL